MKKLSERIPMMFRAQIEGRCQIQRLPQAQQDSTRWVDEYPARSLSLEGE